MKKLSFLKASSLLVPVVSAGVISSCSCITDVIKVNKYTVTFDKNCEDTSIKNVTQTVVSGDKVVPALLTRTNYKLTKWCSDKDGKNVFNFDNKILSNTTLYAQWEAVEPTSLHTVTFKHNDGTQDTTVQHIANNDYATPVLVKRQNYNFVHWYDTNESVAFDFNNTPITSDKTLTAKWSDSSVYTITFNSNGGSAVSSQNVIVNNCAIEPKSPTKDHSVFLGWYINENKFNFSTKITGNLTLTAKWNTAESKTVSFNTGNGSVVDSKQVYVGETVAEPTAPTKHNSEFEYWCEDSDCKNRFDFNTPISGDKTLYAKWNTHPTTLKVCNRSGEEITQLNLTVGDIKNSLQVNSIWEHDSKLENIEQDTQNYTITYKSGDTNIVSFDSNHYVTALSAGTAVYEIASTDAKCTNKVELTINVAEQYLNYLAFNPITIENVEGYEVSGTSKTNVPENLTIPSIYNNKPVLAVADNGFEEYSKIKTVILPSTIKTIGKNAFYRCNYMEYINFPEGLTTISDGAFNCMNRPGILQNIAFPSTLTNVGNWSFAYQQSLKSIYIPKTITNLGTNVFTSCINLSDATIEEGRTSLPMFLFSECTSLSSIAIPEGITYLGNSTFSQCTSLQSITLPTSLTSIGSSGGIAFNGCTNLKTFNIAKKDNSTFFAVNSATREWVESGNILCKVDPDDADLCSLEWIGSSVVNLVVPDNVTQLSEDCCQNCQQLETISFAENCIIKKIKNSACKELNSLISIDFSNCKYLDSIEQNAFNNCPNLSSITFPTTMAAGYSMQLEINCFASCTSLETVTIPTTIIRMYDSCFGGCGLKRMYFGGSIKWVNSGEQKEWTTVDDATEASGAIGDNANIYLTQNKNYTWARSL